MWFNYGKNCLYLFWCKLKFIHDAVAAIKPKQIKTVIIGWTKN